MKLFPNCRLVKGAKTDVLLDLDREKYILIEDKVQLAPFQTELVNSTVKEFSWDSPSLITNAVIYVSEKNGLTQKKHILPLLQFLETSICKHLVIKMDSGLEFEKMGPLLSELSRFNIHSILVTGIYDDAYHTDDFGDFISAFPVIKSVIIFQSPFEANYDDLFHFSKQSGQVNFNKHPDQFTPTIELYSEAQKHNPYFNRKLFIGPDGAIKNAAKSFNVFGYSQRIDSESEYHSIVAKDQFKVHWFVHKDKCKVCKDCGYRYSCVDNRVPEFDAEEKNWYYKTRCNYDPYTNKWHGI